jgi:hypothetical protein
MATNFVLTYWCGPDDSYLTSAPHPEAAFSQMKDAGFNLGLVSRICG